MDILYKDYVTYNILGDELNLFSYETEYGRSTVAELGDRYYYLGDEPANLESALFIWQDMQGKILSLEEFEEVTNNNPEINLEMENEHVK